MVECDVSLLPSQRMSRPDLLYVKPPRRQELSGLSEALTFGFARGVDESRLGRLSAPPLGETTFRSESFVTDLFLDELVQNVFPLYVGDRRLDESPQFFRSVLVSPPKDKEDVEFRQQIITELFEQPERRRLLDSAYASLIAFRDGLCGSDHFNAKTVGVRRRIDILSALRRGVNDLYSATASSRSGLERIAQWIESFRGSERYTHLEHLLDFENSRTVLETRLQVGYDGDLRGFDVVGTTELAYKPFPRGKFLRFFRRIVSLLKGYRFSEEDIMSQLLDRVFSGLEEEVVSLLEVCRHVEFYLRALGFRTLAEERGLKVCLPSFSEGAVQERRLLGLFNPWLCAQGVEVLPCNVLQDEARVTTIITGPNSGGKTRLLQSLAVTQLLAQGGLPVPAREAKLPLVEQLFLSLLEHAKAEQVEGRLGLELMRIRQVFETSGPKALVIMDELCSGTNPSEGERIFEMVLDLFKELGPGVVISTHFLDFATRLKAEGREALAFLQVEIGSREVPTYQFVEGVADTSLARNTAARLGVTREELLGLIETHKLQAATS